jgi:hypothetical protein
LRQSASSACFWSGPVLAEGIMASGHVRRTNRSNTWPHRPAQAEVHQKPLPTGSRSLIAPSSSSLMYLSPARVMVLFAVDVCRRNIWSGPKRGCCKVHNGLALAARPRPLATQSPTPSPGGDSYVRPRRTILFQLAASPADQRNGSPDRQMLCKMTESFRASATRALSGPARWAIARAHSFSCEARGRLLRNVQSHIEWHLSPSDGAGHRALRPDHDTIGSSQPRRDYPRSTHGASPSLID